MNSMSTATAGIAVVGQFLIKVLSGPTVVAAPAPYQTPLYMKTLLARIAAEEAQAGPGADLMAGNCMSCHTPGMILNQPALTRAEWTGGVMKMVKIYKAPIDDADLPAIVTYLASLKVSPLSTRAEFKRTQSPSS